MSDGYIDETAKDAPVYDDRGNVRPRGTKGAKPMTFEERVEIAKQIGAGGVPVDEEPSEESSHEPQPAKKTAAKKK